MMKKRIRMMTVLCCYCISSFVQYQWNKSKIRKIFSLSFFSSLRRSVSLFVLFWARIRSIGRQCWYEFCCYSRWTDERRKMDVFFCKILLVFFSSFISFWFFLSSNNQRFRKPRSFFVCVYGAILRSACESHLAFWMFLFRQMRVKSSNRTFLQLNVFNQLDVRQENFFSLFFLFS